MPEQPQNQTPTPDQSLLLSPEDLAAKQAKWQVEGYTEAEIAELTEMLQSLSEIQDFESSKSSTEKSDEYWRAHPEEKMELLKQLDEFRRNKEQISIRREGIRQDLLLRGEGVYATDRDKVIFKEVEEGNLKHTNELKAISKKVAERLGGHYDYVSLKGITLLSDEVAEQLAKNQNWLYLNGLTSLSDTVAEHLAKSRAGLIFNGLTTIPDSVAERLAKHQGWLYLDSLTSLSDTAAGYLAKHKGRWIFFNHLTTLSDTAAGYLGKYQGKLHLGGLTSLSDTAAERLAEHLHLDDNLFVPDSISQQIKKLQIDKYKKQNANS